MILPNKLNITDQASLARAEEEISKRKAKQFYDSGDIRKAEIGTYAGLAFIHEYLFGEIYPFAGKLRELNIAKDNFRFASVMFLQPSLKDIDQMPQSTFDQIVEKYVEMNVAHPFLDGNGRATRIWLDLIFKQELQQVVDWNQIDKEDYLMAMQRSVVKDIEIKHLLKNALSSRIDDREVYLKGIDASYYYEGYTTFKAEEL
jgi:cell filamentation protein